MSRRSKTKPVESIKTTDAFSNPAFRLGLGTQSPLEGTQYPTTRMTQNYALLNSLYRSSWIVQNIITTIPADMTKKWFKVKTNLGPEAEDQMERLQRKSGLKKAVTSGLTWGRLYGGAVGIILIKGQEGILDKPLELDTVLPGTFEGLYILDRWSGVFPESELVTTLGSTDFGLPKFYTIRDGTGTIVGKLHHTRMIRFTGKELPYYESLAETHWGQSELESIYEELVKRDNVSHNMASLTFRACRDYMEVENADQIFSIASPEVQKRFWSMIQAQSVLDSNFGMRVVNKGDAIHNSQYTFAGLSDVYDAVMMDVAGAARIPLTKLFGRSPAGMNATGESDLQNYYDYIDELRESVLRPILDRLMPVLALSSWGQIPDTMDITFDPLWTPKATELAEIAERKTGAILAALQAGLLDIGAAQKELKSLAGETGLFSAITDEEILANRGKPYRDVTMAFGSLMGLGGDEDAEA